MMNSIVAHERNGFAI